MKGWEQLGYDLDLYSSDNIFCSLPASQEPRVTPGEGLHSLMGVPKIFAAVSSAFAFLTCQVAPFHQQFSS